MLLGQRLLLPSLDPGVIPGTADVASLSVFALGLLPALIAFVVIETIAAIVPRWRTRRIGPARARLAEPTIALTIAVTAVLGWRIAQSMSRATLFREDAWA